MEPSTVRRLRGSPSSRRTLQSRLRSRARKVQATLNQQCKSHRSGLSEPRTQVKWLLLALCFVALSPLRLAWGRPPSSDAVSRPLEYSLAAVTARRLAEGDARIVGRSERAQPLVSLAAEDFASRDAIGVSSPSSGSGASSSEYDTAGSSPPSSSASESYASGDGDDCSDYRSARSSLSSTVSVHMALGGETAPMLPSRERADGARRSQEAQGGAVALVPPPPYSPRDPFPNLWPLPPHSSFSDDDSEYTLSSTSSFGSIEISAHHRRRVPLLYRLRSAVTRLLRQLPREGWLLSKIIRFGPPVFSLTAMICLVVGWVVLLKRI